MVVTSPIEVLDEDTNLAFSFAEMLRYSGPGSPAGVALAYQAMRCGFPMLDPERPIERREVRVDTPFRGPGARDGFELVTRSVTEGRYVIDLSLERPERGDTLEAFVFRLSYRDRVVTLLVRKGIVTDEFVSLARKDDRSIDDERRLSELKLELADRLLTTAPVEVFDTDG
ncbi:MAG: hypothetical protein M3Y91_15540 [Actinomycetota bacterium]|nr:hypothetical protein [Actinomycetota bacterium]